MAGEKPLFSTQTSILIAGALVGAGLFFGLRSSQPAPVQPPPAVPPPVATSPAPPGSVSPTPAPQPTSEAAAPAPSSSAKPEVVRADAKKALDAQRATLVKACFEPSLAKKKDPPKMKLGLNFTFDAQGKQITRGISEDRETARADVLACLSEKLEPITVPPPGANTYVEIPWELP